MSTPKTRRTASRPLPDDTRNRLNNAMANGVAVEQIAVAAHVSWKTVMRAIGGDNLRPVVREALERAVGELTQADS